MQEAGKRPSHLQTALVLLPEPYQGRLAPGPRSWAAEVPQPWGQKAHKLLFQGAASPSYLLPHKNKASKRKTPVVKKTLNPHYNHTFVYNGVNPEDLQHICLELTVWDREPLSSNDFLGGVRLGVGNGEEPWGPIKPWGQAAWLGAASLQAGGCSGSDFCSCLSFRPGMSNGLAVDWMDSTGEELNLWQKMCQYPGSWAEGTLQLRSTMAKLRL